MDGHDTSMGTVKHEGKTIYLTQAAELEVFFEGSESSYVQYITRGKDENGQMYKVHWDTTPAWDAECAENAEMCDEGLGGRVGVPDEADACDWDNPVLVVRVDD